MRVFTRLKEPVNLIKEENRLLALGPGKCTSNVMQVSYSIK